MSEQRSSSAVRNLRSLFENKHGDAASSEPRGRSPGGLAAGGDGEISGLRRTSKVRASFVSVEPTPTMAALQPSESNTGRRGSFGEADGLMDLKKTISQEPAGSETAVSSVAATPNLKPKAEIPGTPAEEKEAENPDKPLTGEQEEPVDMKPADPASGEAVSGGQALPPVAEDLRKSTSGKSETAKAVGKKPMVNGTSKPAAISTKAPSKPAAGTVKSPASAKTPTSSTSASKPTKHESPKAAPPAKAPLKKPSRSSLTAPTAASMARSGPGDKTAGTAASKAKPRETTKPVSLPSHLTAPTASSRAKHEPEGQTKPATTSTRPSTTSKPKPPATSTTKSTRSSLAPEHRPGSRTSQTSHTRRSVPPADGSFLERMMKPTAASASKTHEKTEVKSPPRQKAAPKPKTNGTAAKSASGMKRTAEKKKRASDESSAGPAAPMPSEVPVEQPKEEAAVGAPGEAPSAQTIDEAAEPEAASEYVATSSPLAGKSAPKEPAVTSQTATETIEAPTLAATEPTADLPKASEPATGNETPQAAGETATSAALEATPAGLSSEETIR